MFPHLQAVPCTQVPLPGPHLLLQLLQLPQDVVAVDGPAAQHEQPGVVGVLGHLGEEGMKEFARGRAATRGAHSVQEKYDGFGPSRQASY